MPPNTDTGLPSKRPPREDVLSKAIRDRRAKHAKVRKIEQPKLLTLPDELLLRIAAFVGERGEKSTTTDNAGRRDMHYLGVRHDEGSDRGLSAVFSPDLQDHSMLRSNRNLVNFIQICHRLAPIGREALIDDLIVSWTMLRNFLSFLLRYPSLTQKITRIRLRWKRTREESAHHHPLDASLFDLLLAARLIVNKIKDPSEAAEIRHRSLESMGNEKHIMYILLAVCPNLREINGDRQSYALGFMALSVIYLHGEGRPIEVRPPILDQITRISITEYYSWLRLGDLERDSTTYNGEEGIYALQPLKNLRQLSVPGFIFAFTCRIHSERMEAGLEIFPNLQALTLFIQEEDRIRTHFRRGVLDTLGYLHWFARLQSTKVYVLHRFWDCFQFLLDESCERDLLAIFDKAENTGNDIQTFFSRTTQYVPSELDDFKDLRFRVHTFHDVLTTLRADPLSVGRSAFELIRQANVLIREEDKASIREPRGAEVQWQAARAIGHRAT